MINISQVLAPWNRISAVFSGKVITKTVAVPAVADETLAYLDVSLAGTVFANLPTGTPVIVNPLADLQAAAANAGYMGQARISATGTLRLSFIGTLTGGNVDMTIAVP